MRIRLDGTTLYYEVVGRGTPPVLLLHGGPGLDHTAFRPWLDPLAERHKLIFYDQTGNGRSARPASLEGVDHDTWVDEADALLHRLGCERAVLFGHSYGGYLAQEYALRHPGRVAGLVLCCTAGSARPLDGVLEPEEGRATPRQLAWLQQVAARGVADDAEYAEFFADLLPLYFHRPDPAVLDRLLATTRFCAATVNHAFAVCYPSFDALPQLGRVEVPALVLAGRHDWVMAPEETAEPLAEAIPGARLVVFEESGHYPFIEEAEAFRGTLGDWLDGVAREEAAR